MEAFPAKLRELVLDAYDAGLKTKEIAERFKISRSWARRVKQREREDGVRTALVQQKCGPNPKLTADDRERLAKLIEKTPDATLAELKKQSGLQVSISTLARTLVAMRLTLKKSRSMPPSRTGRT